MATCPSSASAPPSSPGRSSRSSCASTASAALPSCWWSKTPAWRSMRPTTAMCWKTAASSPKTAASPCARRTTSRSSTWAGKTPACAANGAGKRKRPGDRPPHGAQQIPPSMREPGMSNPWNLNHLQPHCADVLAGETIAAMFWNGAAQRGPRVWLRQKHLGIWRSWTWDQAAQAVREIACGLMALDFAPGDCASILSNTNTDWVLADLAILSCAGVANGIYPTDAAAQVHYLSQDSGTSVLFVEDDEQLDKALAVRADLPGLRKIILFDMDGLRPLDDPGVLGLDALRALGRAWSQQHPDALERRVQDCRPEDLAILVYTSGTTGKPKGAMHTHRALTYTVRGYNQWIARTEDDELVCFLPLCHIAERMGGEYFSLYTGARLNFVENPDTVPENMRE